jgi:sugar diacid utilization regulator
MARLTDVLRDQEQAVKGALLEEALESVEARDPLPVTARAAAFGLDFNEPARVMVVRSAQDLAEVCRELVGRLERARVPHLAQVRGDELIALIQGSELDPVIGGLGDVAIGIGRPVTSLVDAHHSLRDAELAVRRGERVTRFEDFDLATFMVSEIPPERLDPKVDEILSVLRANPPLHEALSAYFAHDLDIAATAASLHMHRNSLRYRLARAEQVLGRSLKQPSTIAAVHIALVAEAS